MIKTKLDYGKLLSYTGPPMTGWAANLQDLTPKKPLLEAHL
jgi:hypothetical protein